MKKNVIFPVAVLSFLLLTACPMEDDRQDITVYNYAEYSISFFLADYYSEQFGDPIYPDTTLSVHRDKRDCHVANKDRPTIYEKKPLLKDLYKDAQTDTLCFFIFNTDTLNKYDWETIRKDYKILQRYDLSLQDFERLKCRITYPPSEDMKAIKMYPPYR
jgi:hypothetical protein